MMITHANLAKVLKLHPALTSTLIRSGVLPSKRIGSVHRVFEDALCNHLFKGKEVIPKELPRDWMLPAEAAVFLNMTKVLILRYARREIIPHYRFGDRTVRFRRAELEAWTSA